MITKKVTKPQAFEFEGESVNVGVHFDRDQDGLERVQVFVVSKALPDERQVKIKAVKYYDGHVLTALQNKKFPRPRVPDPMPEAMKLEGDLTGKYVVLQQKLFPGDLINRVVKCTGGFGCNADGHGRKLFGEQVATKKEFAGRREHASRFATVEEIMEARSRGDQVAG